MNASIKWEGFPALIVTDLNELSINLMIIDFRISTVLSVTIDRTNQLQVHVGIPGSENLML